MPGLELVRVSSRDASSGEDAGVDVGDRIAGLDRRAVRFARDRHESGEPLRDQVEAALVAQGSAPPIA